MLDQRTQSDFKRARVAPLSSPQDGRQRALLRLVGLLVLLVVWQIAALWLGESVVASPVQVVGSFIVLVTTANFWGAVASTILCTIAGLTIAMVVGIPLGMLIGSNRFVQGSTRLTVDFLCTIPPVALLPLVVLMFGPTWGMQIVLVTLGAVWPVLLQSSYAVQEIDPQLREVTRAFRLSKWEQWRFVTIPSSTPFLLTGMRVAATIALLLAVAAELLASSPGVGMEIGIAQLSGSTARAFAYVAVAALLGVAINSLANFTRSRMIFWHASVRERGA